MASTSVASSASLAIRSTATVERRMKASRNAFPLRSPPPVRLALGADAVGMAILQVDEVEKYGRRLTSSTYPGPLRSSASAEPDGGSPGFAASAAGHAVDVPLCAPSVRP